ncbi:succinyl-diaminopimelate desuccinylase [Alteromonas sp. CYL-A6]|uniref:succinyl-diaminopimelate desuccinylase n=1 Tax=Alteromonas nitratireducens TaxID=3390813 RepID=UPI0034C4A88A
MTIASLNNIVSRSLQHAHRLIARPSVTPRDEGCQPYLSSCLKALGFACSQHSVNGVSNLIARWGNGSRQIAFSGHTDVVVPGPPDKWQTPPFSPVVRNNRLFGRGAADMKTGIAAMLAATERVIDRANPENATLWWLITSDEEGEAEYGSKWIKQWLDEQGIQLSMCLVGEPTATHCTGDTIKIGRRGSLSANITVRGKQGHVAYPHTCDNAIHKASRLVQALLDLEWDSGSADFPGTSLQVTHMDTGQFTDNLVPGQTTIAFNVRYSHCYTEASLKTRLCDVIERIAPGCDVTWSRACEAYLSKPAVSDCMISVVEAAIVNSTGRYPVISTSGGTSDGRFFASSDTQVVEMGVPNTTIHQVNEHIHVSDLITLEDIYADILTTLLVDNSHKTVVSSREKQ